MAKKTIRVRCYGRMSYPKLFEPDAMEAGQEKKYSIELIVDKDDLCLAKLKTGCAEMMAEKFPNPDTRPKAKLPIIDGSKLNAERIEDGGEGRPEVEDKYILRPKSGVKYPPQLCDQNLLPVTEAQGLLYAGCYVFASVTPFYFSVSGNKGIGLALNGVQFAKHGDPFGSGPSKASDLFDEVESTGGDEENDFDIM